MENESSYRRFSMHKLILRRYSSFTATENSILSVHHIMICCIEYTAMYDSS